MAACIIYSGHGHKHLPGRYQDYHCQCKNIFEIKLPSNLCMQIPVGL